MALKRSVSDATVRGRRVLTRVDYNVPLGTNGQIADDRRISESLPTLQHLQAHGARTILLSHLGRPEGHRDPACSLRPVARRLSSLLGQPVAFSDDCVGVGAIDATTRLKDGEFLLLENLRFHAGEEANDLGFAAQLAGLGELFVEDAFGAVHRAHASTVGVPRRLPAYAGFLVNREIRELSRLVERVERPYMVLVGGAKVADKLPLLRSFLGKADAVLIGGALALPFLAATSPPAVRFGIEPALLQEAKAFLKVAEELRTRVVLPNDLVVESSAAKPPIVYSVKKLPKGSNVRDLGPDSRAYFSEILQGSRTVFWNGPLGVAEDSRYAAGTREVLAALARIPGYHVGAGGDSARIIQELGVDAAFQFVSTGGGAALEFVQGATLPGLAVLPDA